MILNEDKVRRMIDLAGSLVGNSGAGGGGGGIPAGGYVTAQYYSQNFGLLYKKETTDGTTSEVTTEYLVAEPNEIPTEGTETDPTSGDVVVTTIIGQLAKNALVIGNIMLVYDQTNNAIKVVNRDGSTAANFYATGGVSALGYSSGGGGGGDTLTEPLASINEAELGTPQSAGVGIIWDGTQWTFGRTGSIDSIQVDSRGHLIITYS